MFLLFNIILLTVLSIHQLFVCCPVAFLGCAILRDVRNLLCNIENFESIWIMFFGKHIFRFLNWSFIFLNINLKFIVVYISL